jgi:hypothetical protein
MLEVMFGRRHPRNRAVSGTYRLEGPDRGFMHGQADGDFVRLRDHTGAEWTGLAERQSDGSIRFRLRNALGEHASGISDGTGITLRDALGRNWRGVIE